MNMSFINCDLGMCWNDWGNGWNMYNAFWLIGFFVFGFVISHFLFKKEKLGLEEGKE